MVLFSDKKAYFLSGKHPAALGAAATIRDLEPLYDMARTYFKQTYSNSTTGQSGTNRGDRSRDIAPARTAPAVLLPAMTNADQPGQRAKLNPNQGVIYQAKPANPGCFGSPGRRWRPVDYAGNHQRFRPEPDNQPNQLTGKQTVANLNPVTTTNPQTGNYQPQPIYFQPVTADC